MLSQETKHCRSRRSLGAGQEKRVWHRKLIGGASTIVITTQSVNECFRHHAEETDSTPELCLSANGFIYLGVNTTVLSFLLLLT